MRTTTTHRPVDRSALSAEQTRHAAIVPEWRRRALANVAANGIVARQDTTGSVAL